MASTGEITVDMKPTPQLREFIRSIVLQEWTNTIRDDLLEAIRKDLAREIRGHVDPPTDSEREMSKWQ